MLDQLEVRHGQLLTDFGRSLDGEAARAGSAMDKQLALLKKIANERALQGICRANELDLPDDIAAIVMSGIIDVGLVRTKNEVTITMDRNANKGTPRGMKLGYKATLVDKNISLHERPADLDITFALDDADVENSIEVQAGGNTYKGLTELEAEPTRFTVIRGSGHVNIKYRRRIAAHKTDSVRYFFSHDVADTDFYCLLSNHICSEMELTVVIDPSLRDVMSFKTSTIHPREAQPLVPNAGDYPGKIVGRSQIKGLLPGNGFCVEWCPKVNDALAQ